MNRAEYLADCARKRLAAAHRVESERKRRADAAADHAVTAVRAAGGAMYHGDLSRLLTDRAVRPVVAITHARDTGRLVSTEQAITGLTLITLPTMGDT